MADTAVEFVFTIKPGDVLRFNDSVLTVLAGMATIRLETPGKIDRGRKGGLSSKGIRRPRRRRAH